MNIMTIGLSDSEQGFWASLCKNSEHSVLGCNDIEDATQCLKNNGCGDQAFDWILIDGNVEPSSNKKFICMLGALNINAIVQFIGREINVNKNAPKLCSVQRTEAGIKLLKCAMHDMVSDSGPRSESSPESSSPFVFRYNAQSV